MKIINISKQAYKLIKYALFNVTLIGFHEHVKMLILTSLLELFKIFKFLFRISWGCFILIRIVFNIKSTFKIVLQ